MKYITIMFLLFFSTLMSSDAAMAATKPVAFKVVAIETSNSTPRRKPPTRTITTLVTGSAILNDALDRYELVGGMRLIDRGVSFVDGNGDVTFNPGPNALAVITSETFTISSGYFSTDRTDYSFVVGDRTEFYLPFIDNPFPILDGEFGTIYYGRYDDAFEEGVVVSRRLGGAFLGTRLFIDGFSSDDRTRIASLESLRITLVPLPETAPLLAAALGLLALRRRLARRGVIE